MNVFVLENTIFVKMCYVKTYWIKYDCISLNFKNPNIFLIFNSQYGK